jgi:hypothetical protein
MAKVIKVAGRVESRWKGRAGNSDWYSAKLGTEQI